MFFSIVIPTYNRAHLLEKTVNSVLDQTCRDFELLIVDDGSTDETEEIVRRLIQKSRSVHYIYQHNGERAVARNNGLKQAIGNYVLFFDSDDTLYPNHLEEARDYILKNNNPEFLHLRYDIKNREGDIIGEGPVRTFPNKDLIRGNFLSCNGVFIRRDVALKNQFNEDRRLSAMEDWELWLRLSAQYPLHYHNTITSSIINHDERSVLTTQKQALIERVTLLIQFVINNRLVTDYYKGNIQKFKASCYSYIALHLALTKKYRRETVHYLRKSIFIDPQFIFQRRFLAILKHLF